ncbi:glycosyltransferase family 4 protein [Candidatus Halobeggiatoa sp. HSG11]|nr:glycosyltransferase family 4 protein [Candidatus Halobeggiatoa sp. HSG11]
MIFICLAFLLSAGLTLYLSHPKTPLCILDKPNERSLHDKPTPVTGGVAILLACAITLLLVDLFYISIHEYLWLFISCLLIAIISFIDDCKQIFIPYRLLTHCIAAVLLLWNYDLSILFSLEIPKFLQVIISFLFVVWMTNLYNFMDGMDGFAGGMAIFGFGTFAILGGLAEQQLFMLINLIIISAVGGFLIFNFPPAKIFMGDVGASSLGFLAAALSLWGNHEGIFSLWIALLIFSPFIVDATVTLLRRLFAGEKIWLAHKSHYYQRLVELGWGHKRTVLFEYVLMAICCISALLAVLLNMQWYFLLAWFFIYITLIYIVNTIFDS